jgi:DNA-binding SARP family transcriptional activator/tetratricopeptide (TPR) repeat protein
VGLVAGEAAAPDDRAPLRVRVVGAFAVTGMGTEQRPPVGKAQQLLKLLATQYGRFVPSDVLVDALWPDQAPDRGTQNVAVLVSRLRRTLGRDRIEGDRHGYRLVVGPALTVDLQEAADLLRTAENALNAGSDALASSASEQALSLLEHEPALADEPDTEWVRATRRRVAALVRRARVCRWRAALAMDDLGAVVESAAAALDDDQLDEDAARTLMEALQRSERSGAALAVYERLRTTLADELGTDPSPATQSLYTAILRAEPPAPRLRATTGRGMSETTSLVGRDAEIQQLTDLWSEALAGHGGLCLVTGEPGIGKRALVAAVAARASEAGAAVIMTRCFEAERSLFLQPLVEALRSVLVRDTPEDLREVLAGHAGPLADLLPEIERILGPVPYDRAGPEAEHYRILDAVGSVLANLGSRRPTLIVLEDLQDAGQSTLEALHFTSTYLRHARVLIIATSREPASDEMKVKLADVSAQVHLGPLSTDAIAELARRSGARVDVHRLAAWTGGSPLLVTELVRHLRDLTVPALDPDDITSSIELPASLNTVVSNAIHDCGPEVAEFLQTGAVLGRSFLLDDVAQLGDTGPAECARLAERAHRAHLLEVDGQMFRFANDLVRQVAYRSTPEPIRVSRHRRAARMLVAQPEAAAHQLDAAHDWAAAGAAWMTAAATAQRRFANFEARRLLDRALASAEQADDPLLVTRVLLRRGEVSCELGDYAAARNDHVRAVELSRGLMDEELEAESLELLGWSALYARDNLAAADLAAQATVLAESAAAAPRALPSSRLLLGRVRHWDGDYSGAAAAYDSLEPDELDDETRAHLLVGQGALLQHMDRFAEARHVLERAIVLCKQNGLFRPLLQALFFTALARGDAGDLGGAMRALDRARRMLDEYGISYYSAGVDTATSWMLRELGDVGRAREVAERALESARQGGGALEFEQGLHAVLALAECELVAGHVDTAGGLVDEAAGYLALPLPYRGRAQLRLLEMQTRFDRTRADELLHLARQNDSRKYQALAWWHLGDAERAAELAEGSGSDLLVAQVGSTDRAREALNRITAALPADRRQTFVSHSRIAVTIAAREAGAPG